MALLFTNVFKVLNDNFGASTTNENVLESLKDFNEEIASASTAVIPEEDERPFDFQVTSCPSPVQQQSSPDIFVDEVEEIDIYCKPGEKRKCHKKR